MTSADQLTDAALRGDVAAVEEMLSHGAQPDVVNAGGTTALLEAASRGQKEAACTLLERGANPNVAAPSGWTPLFHAVRHGCPSLVKSLLLKGANPSISNKKAFSQQNAQKDYTAADLLGTSRADAAIRAMLAAAADAHAATARKCFRSLDEQLTSIEAEHALALLQGRKRLPASSSATCSPTSSKRVRGGCFASVLDDARTIQELQELELTPKCRALLGLLGKPATSNAAATRTLAAMTLPPSALSILVQDEASGENQLWALSRLARTVEGDPNGSPNDGDLTELMHTYSGVLATMATNTELDARVQVAAESILAFLYAPGTGQLYGGFASSFEGHVADAAGGATAAV